MARMTILLPVNDTITHLAAICELSDFETSYTVIRDMSLSTLLMEFRSGDNSKQSEDDKKVWIKEPEIKSKRKKIQPPTKTYIANIAILPARDNSVIVLTPINNANAERFDKFAGSVKDHFQSLALLLDAHAEPWRNSPPDKQERDRLIWEHRNLGYTWEQVAQKAGCGVSTAKERYKDMTNTVAADSG